MWKRICSYITLACVLLFMLHCTHMLSTWVKATYVGIALCLLVCVYVQKQIHSMQVYTVWAYVCVCKLTYSKLICENSACGALWTQLFTYNYTFKFQHSQLSCYSHAIFSPNLTVNWSYNLHFTEHKYFIPVLRCPQALGMVTFG